MPERRRLALPACGPATPSLRTASGAAGCMRGSTCVSPSTVQELSPTRGRPASPSTSWVRATSEVEDRDCGGQRRPGGPWQWCRSPCDNELITAHHRRGERSVCITCRFWRTTCHRSARPVPSGASTLRWDVREVGVLVRPADRSRWHGPADHLPRTAAGGPRPADRSTRTAQGGRARAGGRRPGWAPRAAVSSPVPAARRGRARAHGHRRWPPCPSRWAARGSRPP